MNTPTYLDDIERTGFFPKGGRIVCGTSGLGGVWGEINPHESVDAILFALEAGVRAFDTAPSYSNAEQYLGIALRQWKGEKPFISTKVGRLKGQTAFDFSLDYSNQGMIKSLENSLKVLGLEKIDLLFLHEPQSVPVEEIDRIVDCLHACRAKGLVELIGIGGNPTPAMYPYLNRKYFDVVSGFLKLDACNLTALEHVLPIIKQEGLAYYAASSLHFSLLGNRFEKYLENGPDGEWITQKEINTAIEVKKLAEKNHLSLSSLSQRYLFSIAEANRVVVGARNVKQMEETLSDWKKGTLTKELFEAVTKIILSIP